MVFHRDGGVITLETVARFGLGSLLHPRARPHIHTIEFTISAPAAWKTDHQWSRVAVKYHICPCGCGVRGENGGMCIETKKEEGWERGNWKGGGATLADGTLGIRLSLKSVSAVFLMCTRL